MITKWKRWSAHIEFGIIRNAQLPDCMAQRLPLVYRLHVMSIYDLAPNYPASFNPRGIVMWHNSWANEWTMLIYTRKMWFFLELTPLRERITISVFINSGCNVEFVVLICHFNAHRLRANNKLVKTFLWHVIWVTGLEFAFKWNRTIKIKWFNDFLFSPNRVSSFIEIFVFEMIPIGIRCVW